MTDLTIYSCKEDIDADNIKDIKNRSRSTWGLVFFFDKPKNFDNYFKIIRDKLENKFKNKDGTTKINDYVFQAEISKNKKYHIHIAIRFISSGIKPYLKFKNLFLGAHIILPYDYDNWKLYSCKEETRVPDTEPQFFLKEDIKLKDTYQTPFKMDPIKKIRTQMAEKALKEKILKEERQKLIDEILDPEDIILIEKIKKKILKDKEVSDKEYEIYINFNKLKFKIISEFNNMGKYRDKIKDNEKILNIYKNKEQYYKISVIPLPHKSISELYELEKEIEELEIEIDKSFNIIKELYDTPLGEYICRINSIKVTKYVIDIKPIDDKN